MDNPRGEFLSFDVKKKKISVNYESDFKSFYSYVAERFARPDFMVHSFPVQASPGFFEMINGWSLADEQSRKNIRDATWSDEGNAGLFTSAANQQSFWDSIEGKVE